MIGSVRGPIGHLCPCIRAETFTDQGFPDGYKRPKPDRIQATKTMCNCAPAPVMPCANRSAAVEAEEVFRAELRGTGTTKETFDSCYQVPCRPTRPFADQ